MSWLYSQALVAEYSAATCSDGAPSAPSSETPMPRAYCSPDKMTDVSRLSRFGMTFAPLTDEHGEGLLTWFREAFLARTSASQGKGQDLAESGLGFGLKCLELLARFDPDSCSWRTPQLSLAGGGVRVVADLAAMGYRCRWGIVGASDVGAPHKRERFWILADSSSVGQSRPRPHGESCDSTQGENGETDKFVNGRQARFRWWDSEPDVDRVANGVAARLDRLKAIGNGQVPAVATTAFLGLRP